MNRVIKESFCWHLLLMLRNLYEESWLRQRIVEPFERFVARKWETSVLEGFLLHEGKLSRAWSESFSCRLLSAVLSLPAAILHRIYRLLGKPMEESRLANLVFDAGADSLETNHLSVPSLSPIASYAGYWAAVPELQTHRSLLAL